MDAQTYIRKINFMINVGTDFDWKKEYEKLSAEDKASVDLYLQQTSFTAL